MDVFSEFLAKIDDPAQRARTEEVLRWVGERFPNLAPRVAWNQPMLKLGKHLISPFKSSTKSKLIRKNSWRPSRPAKPDLWFRS